MYKVRGTRKSLDEMRPEYEFDYSRAKPNRFAKQFRNQSIAVVLDSDVAQVFDTSESVNRLLRSVISAVPKRQDGSTTRTSRSCRS